jgi:hypothetical protein
MTTAGRRRSPQPGRDLDHRVGATDGLAQDHSHLSRLVVVCIGECHSSFRYEVPFCPTRLVTRDVCVALQEKAALLVGVMHNTCPNMEFSKAAGLFPQIS